MRYKTQAQLERFLQHKTRTTSVLNGLQTIYFIPILLGRC